MKKVLRYSLAIICAFIFHTIMSVIAMTIGTILYAFDIDTPDWIIDFNEWVEDSLKLLTTPTGDK